MDLISKLDEIEKQCLQAIAACKDEASLSEIEIKYVSKKGLLSECLKALKDVSPADRPKVGAKANEAKTKIETALSAKKETFQSAALDEKLKSQTIDITLPSRKVPVGSLHPITKVIAEISSIFRRLGFDLSEGPEIDTEFNCFDALNIPADHPARDMQDTFYLPESVKKNVVLRTQTSTVQIRTMLAKKKPPVRILSPGAVFRSDYDQTHSPMFHQIEGLYVDKEVSFAELKGCLLFFAREMFGADSKIRFRPSFFPFVEPGAEMDVWFADKNGGGRWLEILGAGMVHPNVFKSVGYDSATTSGFAFGMGVERIAMLKYGITDLRLLFENDIRFLKQFSGY